MRVISLENINNKNRQRMSLIAHYFIFIKFQSSLYIDIMLNGNIYKLIWNPHHFSCFFITMTRFAYLLRTILKKLLPFFSWNISWKKMSLDFVFCFKNNIINLFHVHSIWKMAITYSLLYNCGISLYVTVEFFFSGTMLFFYSDQKVFSRHWT